MNVMPYINMLKTGENIYRLRTEAGYTVRNLQEIFGFTTPQAIYKWQYGTALPRVDNLVVLAVLFGVPIEAILVIEYNDALKKPPCDKISVKDPLSHGGFIILSEAELHSLLQGAGVIVIVCRVLL